MSRLFDAEEALIRTNALTSLGRATVVLQSADAHDRANGIHRIALDDATVERAADILLQGDMGMCECRRSPFDKHDVNPPCSTRKDAIAKMRRVLAAAVKEEQA